MKTCEFDYHLPRERIAQQPLRNRASSKLMVLWRRQKKIEHFRFKDMPQLCKKGDVLVLNNSKVLPCRIIGHKKSGAKVDVTLSRKDQNRSWYVLAKSSAKIAEGDKIVFARGLEAVVSGARDPVTYELPVLFNKNGDDLIGLIKDIGFAPLPPYISRDISRGVTHRIKDIDHYQTVFAKTYGSVAAPTAGMHFDHGLLQRLKISGVDLQYITLHVGPGTFKPVNTDDVSRHKMLPEYFHISGKTIDAISRAKKEARRIICVGTTTTRTLEAIYNKGFRSNEEGFAGSTDLYIYPPYRFNAADCLLTNFHLPRSTLIMLAAAFAGKDFLFKAYAEAIKKGYRFYSYGDAMMII